MSDKRRSDDPKIVAQVQDIRLGWWRFVCSANAAKVKGWPWDDRDAWAFLSAWGKPL